MKRPATRFALLGVGLLLGAFRALAQPTQTSLIQAWETVQRNDPETVAFEKRGDGSYRFATKRFPFDGELKLLKAMVEEDSTSDIYVLGTVAVELVGLSDKVRQDYARSYALWTGNNVLYYDLAAKRWMGAREFQTIARQRFRGRSLWPNFWSWAPTLVFLAVLVFAMLLLGRLQRKQKQYAGRIERNFDLAERSAALAEKSAETAEKSLRLLEDSNRVLKEILETLREGRPR